MRFLCILIEVYYQLGRFQEAEDAFNKAIDCLFIHLGPVHPLYIPVQTTMAGLMSNMEDAEYLYN